MPHARALTGSRAIWLADVDPALALLPEALASFGCASGYWLHDARWEPGRGCRLAYRVHDHGSAARFVAVDVTRTEWHCRDYRKDPWIPGLPSAADPAWVADRLAPVLDEPVRDCCAEPVRYRPGSHCVMRYVVRTASATHTFYAKVFGDHRFDDALRRTTALAATSDGARLVPALIAAWPDAQATVGAGVPGRALSAILLGDPAVSSIERARLAHRLGDLLATFHAVPDVEAPTWTAADQLISLTEAVTAVRSGVPTLGRRVSTVLDVLAETVPEPGSEVLGHGGFRAGQVILSERGLVVLDIDGLCRCDRGGDLGTALAHLHWQGVRRPDQQQVLRGAERAMLAGYEARAGAVDADSLAWWRAVGLLQVAVRRYRRLEVEDWPWVPLLVDAASDLLMGRQARTAPGGAANLLDPRQMTTVLRLASGSARFPGAVDVVSAEPLTTGSGRRAVVRYLVRGLDGDEAVPVIGKTFTESRRARLLHEHMRMLHDGPFGHGSLRVPEPLGLLPAQRLVLYREATGTPLDRIADPVRTEEGVRRAARWLARLHASRVQLPRRFSLESEVRTTGQWATAVTHVHPHLADRARLLEAGWSLVQQPTGGSEVPIHKDFHAGHVLIGEDTYVIDLDEARQGDPAFDVAHFCAYLGLVRQDSDREPLSRLFVEEYAAATGWHDGGSLRPYLAYTWLKIARQWAVGSGPGRVASPAQRAAGAEHALEKGLRCLNG